MFYAFVLAFWFLVLFVCSLNNKVALFCVCVVCFLFVVNKTKSLIGFLVCILWSCFFFGCVVSNFTFHFFQKKTPKTDTAKTPKTKMQKKDKESVSAVVFTNSVPNVLGGVGYKKCYLCGKPYTNSGFSISWKKEKGPKMWKCWVKNLSK